MRSPSITSSHLNAVAPLVKVKRIHSNRSETETIYKVQSLTTTTSRVASVVPPPKGAFSSAGFRGLKVFSDRKASKENYSPPRIINNSSPPKRASPPALGYVVKTTEPLYAEPKKEVLTSSSSNQPPKSKEERFEEQRQRREQRKRETQTTTPGIRAARPSSIFDSLTKRR